MQVLKQKTENGHGNDDILDLILNMREGKLMKEDSDMNGGQNTSKVFIKICSQLLKDDLGRLGQVLE